MSNLAGAIDALPASPAGTIALLGGAGGAAGNVAAGSPVSAVKEPEAVSNEQLSRQAAEIRMLRKELEDAKAESARRVSAAGASGGGAPVSGEFPSVKSEADLRAVVEAAVAAALPGAVAAAIPKIGGNISSSLSGAVQLLRIRV